MIKFLRVSILLLYLAIPVSSEHFRGPLIISLLWTLYDYAIVPAVIVAIAFIDIVVLTFFIFRPNPRRDRLIFPIGLFILFIPLGQIWFEIFHLHRWIPDESFILTSILFTLACIYWVITLARTRRI